MKKFKKKFKKNIFFFENLKNFFFKLQIFFFKSFWNNICIFVLLTKWYDSWQRRQEHGLRYAFFVSLFLLLLLFFPIQKGPLLFSKPKCWDLIFEKFHPAGFDPPTFPSIGKLTTTRPQGAPCTRELIQMYIFRERNWAIRIKAIQLRRISTLLPTPVV